MTTCLTIMISTLAAAGPAGDAVDRPIPPETLERFTAGMLSGEHLGYGLYGRKPIRWLKNATGDRMLGLAKTGALPDDGAFKHVSFISGSFWDNCRSYYMAYRITGDRRFVRQLCSCARLIDCDPGEPALVLPQDRRRPRPADPVAAIPHEAAAASNFIGHALAARLILQIARRDRSRIADDEMAAAKRRWPARAAGGSSSSPITCRPGETSRGCCTSPPAPRKIDTAGHAAFVWELPFDEEGHFGRVKAAAQKVHQAIPDMIPRGHLCLSDSSARVIPGSTARGSEIFPRVDSHPMLPHIGQGELRSKS